MEIPSTMQAFVVQGDNDILLQERAVPHPTGNQVLIKLKAAGLNRRDQWIREGMYPNIQAGVVLGSDGCGDVVAEGNEASQWLGKPVVINPNVGWGDNPVVQSKDYTILGMPTDGTFAQYIIVEADRLVSKPTHLDYLKAAAIPLAGLTAYRAVFGHGQLTAGQSVLISGAGGGVATFAMQFSIAQGANVWITSGRESTRDRFNKLGVQGSFDYRKEHWVSEAKAVGGFDLIIDSAGGNQFNSLSKLLKPGGKLIFYGATNGVPDRLDLHSLFWRQCTIQGSTMGNDEEFKAMVAFINQHKIEPIIGEVYSFEQAREALESLKSSREVGKTVLNILD